MTNIPQSNTHVYYSHIKKYFSVLTKSDDCFVTGRNMWLVIGNNIELCLCHERWSFTVIMYTVGRITSTVTVEIDSFLRRWNCFFVTACTD